MTTKKEFTIPPSSALAFSLHEGNSIKIIDPEGNQVSDFVAISADDAGERFDQDRTRVNNWSNLVKEGTALYSNRNARILEVVEDSVGVHDMLFPCCSSFVYENMFHVSPRKGCFENLAIALSNYGISADEIPNPLNIFMKVILDSETGKIDIGIAPSRPGDFIEIRALKISR